MEGTNRLSDFRGKFAQGRIDAPEVRYTLLIVLTEFLAVSKFEFCMIVGITISVAKE